MAQQYTIGILGATGVMGQMIARILQQKGHKVLLGARRSPNQSISKIDFLDHRSLENFLAQVPLVIQCAGPYADIGLPVIEAALTTGTQLIDLSGEQDYVRQCYTRFNEPAMHAGVAVVNAVAVEGAIADALTRALSERHGIEPDSIHILNSAQHFLPSPGTLSSALGVLRAPMMDYVQSTWRPAQLAADLYYFDNDGKPPRCGFWIPGVEAVLISRHSKATRIASYLATSPQRAKILAHLSPHLHHLAHPLIRQAVGHLPALKRPAHTRFRITVEIGQHDAHGNLVRHTGFCEGGDVYQVSAVIAAQTALHMLAHPTKYGVLSPSQAMPHLQLAQHVALHFS